MGEAKFELEDVTLKRPGRNAAGEVTTTIILNKITTFFLKEKITAVLGPSGSGKSSLLRLLNRLEDPAAGRITLDGQDLQSLNIFTLRRRVGMVRQLPTLFPGTVLENISYGPRLRGIPLSRDRAGELILMVGLGTELLDRRADSLSIGQQQRVSLARTLANEPEVLLLDEPTSALDPTAAANILHLMVDLKSRLGLTIILVTHILDQARQIADEVLFMHRGEIVETAPAQQFFTAPRDPRSRLFLSGELEG
ncbi:phosphate ABC transporter ATP-binding protein [Neomoorella thermoacetica]|uniref:Phosphate import ATP-binding protein PstB n=3 Tax=Neomoorella thermoacetica TaxID=1525 RepID=A0A1D7XAF9_NEOTH|nr:phosphate ABC transporter ATP-binding protein [Moorella thermoacetica]AKX96581.1 phosphate import ATP-binding protein PstB [Moorella thermoacetica]AOQ23892.1 Phosphate import ATP-binding protein PstB [Moorella thermoacetica]OIQ12844.1 phosphate import ATP-binding protein PstB [Moorella thermoacetica]OIQ56310.1 phosphate import ATP-binding protein PstB [Moorella thermoacetica]OIQ57751.1 phosphate import ATP-binding protein PstB [Moorella thermoacetica]